MKKSEEISIIVFLAVCLVVALILNIWVYNIPEGLIHLFLFINIISIGLIPKSINLYRLYNANINVEAVINNRSIRNEKKLNFKKQKKYIGMLIVILFLLYGINLFLIWIFKYPLSLYNSFNLILIGLIVYSTGCAIYFYKLNN
ncbi:MAG TPA: hypothetical protein PK307_02710 [Spirochaetota bacterium]|nr:hypothetical protein [Spirochaetota bacterium]HOD13630.1 hypothetical protein [Spirochaetota bacterium]HPG50455.1 hypothetical protein [Spirochaetota bacterium]HPN12015.1 hypothetical protein [Spirochaetota bacterium]HQL81086.1 hypothetical protein [Spirochaetota bacterium]